MVFSNDFDEAPKAEKSDLYQSWIKASLKNAFEYLKNKSDIELEIPSLLNQLDSLQSFQDIRKVMTSDSESKLLDWCGGESLNSILNQSQSFDSLNAIWINQFKTNCIDKIISLYHQDNNDFLSVLNHFLIFINSQPERKQLVDDEFLRDFFKNNNIVHERQLIESLEGRCNNLTTSNDELTKVIENFLKSTKTLKESENCWTTRLKFLTKVICKRHLLPLAEVEEKEEDGRKIVVVKGNVIFISKIKSHVVERLTEAEEVHIVGLDSVHVDCDLENDIWHGMNVVVVTNKLLVVNNDGNGIKWNLSGRNDESESRLEKAKDGQFPGDDGVAGEHGLPGESGGNVLIKCSEMFNAENWTIMSNGGRGKDGQAGGDGKDGQDGQDASGKKPSKVEFNQIFTTLINTLTEPSYEEIHKKYNEVSNDMNNTELVIGPSSNGYSSAKFCTDDRIDVVTIYHQKSFGKNKSLILWKGKRGESGKMGGQGGEGGKGGRGGYGGTIIIQNGTKFIDPSPQTDNIKSPKTSRIRGEPGSHGKDGAGGNCGKHGKSMSDVGYIDNLYDNPPNWKQGKAYYIGFESDKQFVINYLSENELTTCQHPYTNCQVNNEDRFAVLLATENTQDFKITQQVDKTAHGRQREAIQWPLKKTSISQQSLVQHLAQVAGRNCTKTFDIDEIATQTLVDYNALCNFSSYFQQSLDVVDDTVVRCRKSVDSRYVNSQFQSESDLKNELIDDGHIFSQLMVDDEQVNVMEKLDSDVELIKFCANEYLEDCLSQVFNYLEPQTPFNDDINKQLEDAFSLKEQSTIYEKVKHLIEEIISENPSNRNSKKSKKQHGLAEFNSKEDDFTLITVHENVGRSSGIDNGDDFETLTFKFHNEYFSTSTKNNIILLRKNNLGVWQRFDCKPLIRSYCDRRIQQAAKFIQVKYKKTPLEISETLSQGRQNYATSSKDLEAHRQLLQWLKDNTTEYNKSAMNQMITSVEMFNPEYGCTPGELSSLLLIKLKEQPQIEEQLAKDIGMLAERVFDYDSRHVDPIFYLTVVENLTPFRWKYEFVLLEIEERLKLVFNQKDRAYWRRTLYRLNDKILSLLEERLRAAGESGNRKIRPQKLKQTLEIMTDKEIWSKEDVVSLSRLPLSDWLFDVKSKIWLKEVNETFPEEKSTEETDEAIYLLLELENKKGDKFYHNNVIKELESKTVGNLITKLKEHLYYDDDHQSEPRKRGISKIMGMIEREKSGNTSKSIASVHKKFNIKERLWKIHNQMSVIDCPPVNGMGENQIQIETFLCKFICAVDKIMKIKLHDTQRVAIYTLLMKENNTLVQVPTGEGKSLIVAGLAIYYAVVSKEKVDIITSNNLLAERDSNELKELYQHFSINVAHNCHEEEDDRIKAYKSNVVYGELSNFQRDHLLDEFYGRNIRSGRPFECVVMDEVDCMLLDRGNNMLYLTHDIPGMEMLESLYVFIWEKVRTTDDNFDDIKAAILFDLYGEITINHLELVHGPLKNQPEDKEALWSHLIQTEKIIDQQGRLIIDENTEVTISRINKINYSTDLNPKLVFFFRQVLERERHIHIPQHLLSFVDRHLDTFLENAVRALKLNADEDYVVDFVRSGSNTDPQVIIIDRDTGTDQTMSQWDGGLHQFLQLKEGCRLTLQSLKSVFISNLTYINRYKNLTGLTGTLGSQPEREFLKEMYKCDFFSIPTAFPKRFAVHPSIVVKTKDKWLEVIVEETQRILEKKRSLVVFCRSIKDVKIVNQKLRSEFDKQSVQIQSYTRDYQKFSLGSDNEIDIGQVIVATNLAGRGTDIKISDELRDNGGLHICLTYLPENVRIEEQAMGRAGRKGHKGSGILILYEPDTAGSLDEEWSKSKIFDMKKKRNRIELHRISRLSDDYNRRIVKQEKCFDIFREQYKKLKSESSDAHVTDAICSSLLDQWALWIDQIDYGLSFETQSIQELEEQLNKAIINQMPTMFELYKNMTKVTDNLQWMTAGRSIDLAKNLAIRSKNSKNQSLKKATLLLDKLIKSNDSFLYPAAHYLRAFVYTKDTGGFKKNKTDFVRMLRATETILEQHIDMQINYSRIINRFQRKGNQNSRYAVNGYKEQKANTVHLFSHYISSIHSLLGSRCSVSDLQEVVIDVKNSENYFQQLVKTGCIVNCQVNDPITVPDRDKVMKKIAKDYNVNLENLEKFLKDVKNPSEEEMKNELEKTGMIRCTRRTFWNWLVQRGVLILPTSNRMGNVLDLKDPSSKYVLFDPAPDNIQDLLDKERCLEDFEYATLQTLVLKEINLIDVFGKLTSEKDLIVADIINEAERRKIWDALIEQKILTTDGQLSRDYKEGMTFKYPDCPLYENAVTKLIKKTYVAELVRRQWLEEKDPIRRFEIIESLPLDPYQDMLCDLQAAHIISSNRVTNDNRILFEDKVKKITRCPEEQHRICQVLEIHRAQYAVWETPEASLEQIISTIWKTGNYNMIEAIRNELYTFKLAGFTHVIKTSEAWSLKMIIRYAIITSIGVAFGAAIGLCHIPGMPDSVSELVGMIATELFKKGVKDIEMVLSALNLGRNLTWADYRRRMFKDLTISTVKWRTLTVSRVCDFIKKRVQRMAKNDSNTDKDVIDNEVIESNHPNFSPNSEHERMNGQIEYIVSGKLGILFRQLGADLNKKTKPNEEFKTTLNNLYQFKDPIEAEWLVKNILQTISYDRVDTIQMWLTKIVKRVPSTHVNQSQDEAESIADNIFIKIKRVLEELKVVDELAEMTSGSQIKSLHEELKKIPNFSSFNATTNCEINESEEFQKTLHYITIKLREEAEKAMESLKKRVFEKVSEAINYYSVNKLRHLEKQRINQWSQRIRNQMLTGKNQHQQYRIQACLKLIKKTKNLNLLAALIRENKVPDQDPFIQAGFLNALPLMQAKYPSLTLTLVKSCQDVAILIETDPEVAKTIRLGWRNYANQKCPFKMFPICGVGCEDDDCELRGLNDYVGHRKYVKEAFVGKWLLVNSFENTRAKNLENQSVIKLNIDTFMLPISRSITINAQRQKFIQAALKHLQLYLEKGIINEIEKKDLAIVIENHLD